MHNDDAAVLRFRAVAEADAGSLVRVLQFFQVRNVTPRRIVAQRLGAELLEIEIEIEPANLAPEAFRAVVSKVNELPIVLAAVSYD